jgi:signal transduction histidine kinase
LEAIASGLEGCIRDLEAAVYNLRPPLLSEGLVQAMRRLAAGWERASSIQVHLSVELDQIALPSDVEAALYRVLQEALSNAEDHAEARNVWIRLWATDEPRVFLELADDGRGFAPGQLGAGDSDLAALGLRSMRQRVENLGGQLTVRSAPGEGTTVIASIPL